MSAFKKILVSVLGVTISISALAETRKIISKIYPIGKMTGEPPYVQETLIDNPSGDERTWTAKITNTKGEVLMTEKATMTGSRVISQYVEQLQIGEAYELKVEGSKATFKTFAIKDGKAAELKENKTVTLEKNLVMGPSSELFLQSHWDDLVAGKTVKADFGIFELSRTVGFQFKKIKESENSIEITMKPSNIFVSALVDTIHMEFDKKTKRITYYRGRIPLREFKNNEWKALDAEIQYQ